MTESSTPEPSATGQSAAAGPAAGWYPDPTGVGGSRYWDGANWTDQAAPATGWQQGGWQSAPTVESGVDAAGYGTYTPVATELTGARMRRVPRLFDDMGRILRRGWWPIVALSGLLWLIYTAVVVLFLGLLLDVGRLLTAANRVVEAFNEYPDGGWPQSVSRGIGDAFAAVPRTDDPVAWITFGVVALVLTQIVICVQIVGVNRVGIDAAAGQPTSFAAGWHSGWAGGLRLFGYVLMLSVLIIGGSVLFIGVIALISGSAPALAVLLSVVFAIALTVLAVWLTGRLLPISVQVIFGPGALRWSWDATRGRFWAVLGRYLLWSIVASIVGQIVLTVVLMPLSLVAAAAAANPGPTVMLGVAALYLISLPLSMVITALTYLGVVPIWRDLTTAEPYRAIDATGIVRPTPA